MNRIMATRKEPGNADMLHGMSHAYDLAYVALSLVPQAERPPAMSGSEGNPQPYRQHLLLLVSVCMRGACKTGARHALASGGGSYQVGRRAVDVQWRVMHVMKQRAML
jgi:hypothetical protein